MEKEVILYFTGIDCPNCASKIEALLNKDVQITSARINYLEKKIIITYTSIDDIVSYTEKIARKIEVDAKIYDHIEEEHSHHHHHDKEGCCHEHHHDEECCCQKHHHDKEGCCHEHHHDEECCCQNHHHDKECCHHKHHYKSFSIFFVMGIVVMVSAIICGLFDNQGLKILSKVLYIVSYLLIAYKIIIKSFKNIIHGNIFDENLLMMIASVGAIIIDENLEAILVVVLYTIGEYFQDKALGDSTIQIANLTKLKVDYTTLSTGEVKLVKDINVGDEIVVKVGERIPLDGVVVEGTALVDTKVLTGESIPQEIKVGEEVLSGCINLNSVIKIKVLKVDEDSTASKIIKMVSLASDKKSKTEMFITKFSRIYTPVVLILAVLVFLVEWLLIPIFSLNDALNNSFVFLVTSCPCALVISIPLAFYGGIGKCSSYGILVKGGNYLEVLEKTKLICFDKTGTLTKGNFVITLVIPNSNFSKEEVLKYLIAVENYSNHPIAKAICSTKQDVSLEDLVITDVVEIAGYGIQAKVNQKEILIGNEKLMVKENIDYIKNNNIGSILYLSLDGCFLGSVVINDEIKKETYDLINDLKQLNIKPYMLTGDKKEIADKVAKEVGITNVYAELLPGDKLGVIERLLESKNKNESLVYVGDGINDTPSLKIADVGVAIGGFGNDEAVEVSDVVLLSDKMINLVKAIKIAKFTKKILIQNIVFALSVKFIALIIGTIGLLGSYGMLLGVFADVGVCLIAILNTLRILKQGD